VTFAVVVVVLLPFLVVVGGDNGWFAIVQEYFSLCQNYAYAFFLKFSPEATQSYRKCRLFVYTRGFLWFPLS
jgi:hypothetical protein